MNHYILRKHERPKFSRKQRTNLSILEFVNDATCRFHNVYWAAWAASRCLAWRTCCEVFLPFLWYSERQIIVFFFSAFAVGSEGISFWWRSSSRRWRSRHVVGNIISSWCWELEKVIVKQDIWNIWKCKTTVIFVIFCSIVSKRSQ